ncbi:MAG: hypothetical protein PHX83_12145 [Acidobacteriia bacterium]|nr:hypothetical protein [Terriglobia bacterium]
MEIAVHGNHVNFSLNLGRKPKPEPAVEKKPPKSEREPHPSKPRTRESGTDQWATAFNEYHPLKHNIGLFRVIRESIPFLDIAVIKLIRLIGDFEYKSEDRGFADELNEWKRTVQVNWFQKGMSNWISQLSDSAFGTGMGFGETVLLDGERGIHRLKIALPDDFRFVWQDDKLVFGMYDDQGFRVRPIEGQEYIHYLAFDQREGNPYGYSLFYSLPFVAQILMRMEKSWENYVWRVGDPIFATIVEGADGQTPKDAQDIASSISTQFSSIMQLRRKGQTADIHGAVPFGAKVSIDALGKGLTMINFDLPARTILEQIVAKTGLAPYMLGLSWSTTERMSKDQSDLIVSNVKSQRTQLDSIIDQVTKIWMATEGRFGEYWVEWNAVNLMDETGQSEARLNNAMAAEQEILNIITMLGMGWMNEDEATGYLQENNLVKEPTKDWLRGKVAEVTALRATRNLLNAWN